MGEAVTAALITGGITLLGVLISNGRRQAIIETKLEALTREVRQHNNFAQRMPVVENEIKHIKDDIHKYHD